MATRPATTPDAAPREVAWPSRMRSVISQLRMAAPVATMVFTQTDCRRGAGSDRGTGIEAEPAEPQQAGTKHDQRQVVRPHRIALPAEPLAQDEGQGQTGGAGVDVDRGATGEVDRLQVVGDPAADVVPPGSEVEHPVGDREVDDGAPDHGEDHPDAELRPIGDGAGDQGDGDDREHGLERDEGHHRVDAGLVVEGDLGGRTMRPFRPRY